jgi:Tfp pilus assembly protein PilN
MAKKSASINLLKSNKNDTLEQIINWTLTVGRAMVIIVELIALGAFLFRFGLDQQLIDLRSTIKQKQAIVTALKDSEDTYRNLQDRLGVAYSFSNLGKEQVKVFKDIIGFAPSGIVFTNVTFTQGNVRIEANAFSVNALSKFVDALKKYPVVRTVSLDKIENKTANALITVSITATLKQ